MILQSLNQLYSRLADVDRPGFAPMGLSWAIVLSKEGQLESLLPLRKKALRGNKLVPTPISAPSPGKRTSGDKAGFLADKTEYVLGWDTNVPSEGTVSEKLQKRFQLFRAAHLSARDSINQPDFELVCRFLEAWHPEEGENLERIAQAANAPLEELLGTNLAFQISGKTGFVHELPEVIDYWSKASASSASATEGFCLVTGEKQPLARLHDPSIKGVPGAQSSGASIVSFNLSAFTSYGKEQSLNAPVGESAAFAYCTALNWLLSRRERKFRIGDTTAVLWTDHPTPIETLYPWMISGIPESEDEELKKRVHKVLRAISLGTLGKDELGDTDVRYYVLGLSPNASRLSVRFWHTGTLDELITNLKRHYDALRIVRQWDESNSKKPEPESPNVFELLRQTAREADGIPPLLAGALMRSILLGIAYPNSLVQAVMNRIRADRDVNYLKAAILKAWLVRNHQDWLKKQQIEMTTALHKDTPSVAYQLGRLFAVYEQAQRAAHEFKLERTIRETMYSSASANPLAVFGRLDRLNKHHLQKLNTGSNRFFSDLIDEIHQKIEAPSFYPSSLNLKGQSLFCIGYYHQRHDLRPTKKENE